MTTNTYTELAEQPTLTPAESYNITNAANKSLAAKTDIQNRSKSDQLEIMHQLAQVSGYKERVPDINTFIDDPYYLGKVLGKGLYPIWREAANKLYPTPYHTTAVEVYLTGGIGLGKTTMSKLIVCYDICKLLCLENPHKYFSLLETDIIRVMLMNANKDLAYGVLYSEIKEWIENSPFFKEKASKLKRTMFINNIDIGVGSRGKDALGQATVGCIFSEINDMTVVHGQAEDNFDTVYTRMNSRFGGKGREIIGHLILDSSNKGVKSFLDTRLEEKKKNGDTDFMVFRFAHWEAKWHMGNYSGKFFRVYAGDENRDPFIVRDGTSRELLATLNQDRFIDAPEEHRQEFEFNIIKSLRDLAGVSTYSSFSYITAAQAITGTFNRQNAATKNFTILDFFNEDKLINMLPIKSMAFINKAPRFIHIDLGLKNDSTGIACTYLDGYAELEMHDPLSGKTIISREPKFVTEWVLEITCVPGQEVPIFKIKNLMIEAKKMGYPIYSVSTDGFQSTNLRQDLLLKGFDTQLISCDRTKDPYNYLRNTILEGRLSAPDVEKLITEVRELEEGDQKFDHPVNGTKDILDAVCGSVWNCSQQLHKIGTTTTASDVSKGLDALIAATGSPEDQLRKMLSGR